MRSYLNQAITICNAELQHEGSRLGRLEDWNSNPRRVSNYCPGPVAAMIEKWPIVNLFLLSSKYAFLRRWGIEIPNNCSIVLKPIFIFDAHWEHFFSLFQRFRVAPLSSKMIMTILLEQRSFQVHSHFFYSNLQLWRRWMQKTDIFSGQHWEEKILEILSWLSILRSSSSCVEHHLKPLSLLASRETSPKVISQVVTIRWRQLRS